MNINKFSRILVVEDNLSCAVALELILKASGYAVLTASDGNEGLRLLSKHKKRIGLILLDLMMPDITGLEFLQEAKSQQILGNIPVIIQSAGDYAILAQAMALGAHDYIRKPFEREELLEKVQSFLAKKAMCSTVRLCA